MVYHCFSLLIVGKTSLIRALSGCSRMVASPRVFTTLDVTHHSACLPAPATVGSGGVGTPGLRFLLLDTIGFMADLPRNLIAAFRATLIECLDAVSLSYHVPYQFHT